MDPHFVWIHSFWVQVKEEFEYLSSNIENKCRNISIIKL